MFSVNLNGNVVGEEGASHQQQGNAALVTWTRLRLPELPPASLATADWWSRDISLTTRRLQKTEDKAEFLDSQRLGLVRIKSFMKLYQARGSRHALRGW